MRKIDNIINHWSVTSPESTVQDLRRIHLNKGWRDIGYHRVILHPNSKQFKTPPTVWSDLVKTGRHLDTDLYLSGQEVGAHALGYNSNSVGIVTILKPGNKLHPLQKEAILQVNNIFNERFRVPVKGQYLGHRDVNATQCPGDELYNYLQLLKRSTWNGKFSHVN